MSEPTKKFSVQITNITPNGEILSTSVETISADSFENLEKKLIDLVPQYNPAEWDVFWYGKCG